MEAIDKYSKEGSNPLSPRERMLRAIANVQGLDEVEELINSKIQSEAPLLQEISAYLLNLGGKRMRPLLTLLVAKAFGMQAPSAPLIDVAAGVELIHMATLLHDDIIDKSPLRRHQLSALLKFGSENTLLAGDFLLVRAFSLCARLDRPIIDATERACIDLTEGEILETPLTLNDHHDVDSALEIGRKKTAALFRLACFSGSHLAKVPAEASTRVAQFGEALGVAFQILDDILDVTSDEDILGKKAGIDLHERKPSIVNVLWRQSGSKLAKQWLSNESSANKDSLISEALLELRKSPVIDQARAIALTYTSKALESLEAALQSASNINLEGVEDLRSIVDYTVERVN